MQLIGTPSLTNSCQVRSLGTILSQDKLHCHRGSRMKESIKQVVQGLWQEIQINFHI